MAAAYPSVAAGHRSRGGRPADQVGTRRRERPTSSAADRGEGPQFIIRDRDDKFGAAFDRVAKGAGVRVIKTAVRAPLMNSVVERFIRSSRRECLDHVIILGERHLCSVLTEFGFQYFNKLRPHQGIGQRVPAPSGSVAAPCTDPSKIVAVPVLGGLHHGYRMAA